jgi:SAM-dependent methyltransferase
VTQPAGRAEHPALWDERFRPAELPYGEQPSLFLVEQLPRLGPPGRALLPGDGGGRNGVWLAGQGWQATSLDFSPVALARARELAGRQRVPLDTVQADVTDLVLAPRRTGPGGGSLPPHALGHPSHRASIHAGAR